MTDEDLIKQANAALMAIPEMLPQNMAPYLQKMFITGYRVCEELNSSGIASNGYAEGDAAGWIELKEGNPLPDYDEPVLWLHEDGSMYVDALDKDGNPHIFGNKYEGTDFEEMWETPKATHWRQLPIRPNEK